MRFVRPAVPTTLLNYVCLCRRTRAACVARVARKSPSPPLSLGGGGWRYLYSRWRVRVGLN